MDNFDNLLNSLMRLLAVQSVQSAPCSLSPFGEGVGKALDIFADTAKKLGFDVHNEGGYYVTADIGEGEPFAVLGHLDTVPFGEGWTHSPLGEIDGGVIYGRGVMDDKGPLLACLFATAQLLDEGYALTRRIRFFAGGNEESGWKCAERYAQLDKWPREGFSPDADFPVIACEKGVAHLKLTFPLPAPLKELSAGTRVNVVPDFCRARLSAPPANAREVSVQERGGEYIVTAHGKPAHGSTPQLGENAAHKVLHALAGVSPRLARLEKALCTLDGSGLGCALQDEKSGALTSNTGVLQTDKESLHAFIDIRYPVTFTQEEIVERIRAELGCAVQVCGAHAPHYVDENSPLVRGLCEAYAQVTGQSCAPLTIGGATFARVIPGAVGFGPCFPGDAPTIHQKDECVSVEKFRLIYRIYKQAIKNMCCKKREIC